MEEAVAALYTILIIREESRTLSVKQASFFVLGNNVSTNLVKPKRGFHENSYTYCSELYNVFFSIA